jgi:hypothetical protein
VQFIKNVTLAGSAAMLYDHIGDAIADVMAKAVFGELSWNHLVRGVCCEGEWQAAKYL